VAFTPAGGERPPIERIRSPIERIRSPIERVRSAGVRGPIGERSGPTV